MKSGINTKNLDTSVKPGEDFYQFANGGWLKANPIPDDETRWGSFNTLRKESQQALGEICKELIERTDIVHDSNEQKVRDFYLSAMNEQSLNLLGVTSLKDELTKIDNIKTINQIFEVIAHHHKHGISSLFSFSVYPDMKASHLDALYIGQGGLGMPDRDYYLNEGEQFDKIRDEYKKHLEKMLYYVMDIPLTSSDGLNIYLLEKALAESSMTKTDQREVEKVYNSMTLKELVAITPKIPWDIYFRNLGVIDVEKIIVMQPDFFKKVSELIYSIRISQWKIYLRWCLIDSTAAYLSDEVVNEDFAFNGGVIMGAKEIKPRWRRTVLLIDALIGETIGKLYVEKHFSHKAKDKICEFVDFLMTAFGERIKNIDWMSPETKEKALAKLGTVERKLGYPEIWRDYSALEIKNDSYVQNYLRASAFESARMLAKVGKPVNKYEWFMSPATVNAYYNESWNEIVFPAAIMQPPFFDAEASDAVNFAGICSVIGHEFTHGFDDQGSKFDKDGNLNDWWTEDDRKLFNEKAKVLVDQYNSYIAIGDMHVNGQLTLGENIADLGGIAIAYDAFKKFMRVNGVPESMDGFTPEQLFFLGWAQIWRNNIREETARDYAVIDPHSPSRHRTNGPLTNMEIFYKVFEVGKGDSMYRPPNTRAKIW